jgi:hypothetical protein
MLHDVMKELEGTGLVEETGGCKVVFLDGFTARDGVSRLARDSLERETIYVQRDCGEKKIELNLFSTTATPVTN